MCIYNRVMRNPKYQKNKKNGGVVPPLPLDGTGKQVRGVLQVPIGCGKCMECTKKKRNEWSVRLHEELRTNKTKAYMVSLTFSTEELRRLSIGLITKGYELDNNIAYKAVDNWANNWKKEFGKVAKRWFITEIGGGRYEHMHIHGIIWTDKGEEAIRRKWKYGYAHIGEYVNERTVSYIIKYVVSIDQKHQEYKPIIMASKGIGLKYVDDTTKWIHRYQGSETVETYRTKSGHKLPLPMIYRNGLWTEAEREMLWMLKLGKDERYVRGQKVDTSKGLEEYIRVRDEARRVNRQLKYEGGFKKDEDKEYEKKLRERKLEERLIERPLTAEAHYQNVQSEIEHLSSDVKIPLGRIEDAF